MQYISCLYISHLILNKLLYSTLLKMKILLVYFVLSFGLVWFQFCDMNVNEFIVHFILYSQSNMSIPFTQLHHSHLCVLSLQKPLKWHTPQCNPCGNAFSFYAFNLYSIHIHIHKKHPPADSHKICRLYA